MLRNKKPNAFPHVPHLCYQVRIGISPSTSFQRNFFHRDSSSIFIIVHKHLESKKDIVLAMMSKMELHGLRMNPAPLIL